MVPWKLLFKRNTYSFTNKTDHKTEQLWFYLGGGGVEWWEARAQPTRFFFPSGYLWRFFKDGRGGFPGGSVVKNPPANAGDTGSSPGPGRSHMPRSNYARVPQLLSLCSRAHMTQLLSPRATTTEACVPRARAPQ